MAWYFLDRRFPVRGLICSWREAFLPETSWRKGEGSNSSAGRRRWGRAQEERMDKGMGLGFQGYFRPAEHFRSTNKRGPHAEIKVQTREVWVSKIRGTS